MADTTDSSTHKSMPGKVLPTATVPPPPSEFQGPAITSMATSKPPVGQPLKSKNNTL